MISLVKFDTVVVCQEIFVVVGKKCIHMHEELDDQANCTMSLHTLGNSICFFVHDDNLKLLLHWQSVSASQQVDHCL